MKMTSNGVKTIFLTVYDGTIAQDILYSDAFRVMAREARLIYFAPESKIEYYRKRFEGQNVVFEIAPPATYPWFEGRFWLMTFHSIPTATVRIVTKGNYYSGMDSLPMYCFKRLVGFLGRFGAWHWFIRFLYKKVPDRSFAEYFEKYKPDLVFAPNMIGDQDMRMLKEAKKRGVKTIGMMKSWDNITSKAFVSVHPDWFLAQNEVMRNDLVRYVQYPANRITVTGFSRFDSYADHSLIVPRKEFCERMGIDPSKKILLYAAGGDALTVHDPEVIELLIRAIEKDIIPKNRVHLLLRPHPAYDSHEDRFRGIPFVTVDRPGHYVTPGKLRSFEFENPDTLHLMNSLAHCDVKINTASTTSIEAAIFDKPIINIGFDGAADLPYVLSVRRFYDFEHYRNIAATGGIRVAWNKEELFKYVNEYLENPTRDSEGRKKIVALEIGNLDSKAGERVGREVVKHLR
jgi:CDP-glycerol glycerophosphotransferase (TagB/SpsB family)